MSANPGQLAHCQRGPEEGCRDCETRPEAALLHHCLQRRPGRLCYRQQGRKYISCMG